MARNRLADESSRYLLQHADNPVAWWPWCQEALDEARRDDKPILLSIGYSACHWCHVMAHESFEDEQVAQLMNEHFVSIKVDREERPDVDQVYQTSVQLMQQAGSGWPLTVFLTPDGRPFWGGTYFPREPRWGMPSFPQILEAIVETWRDRRPDVEDQGRRVVEAVGRVSGPPGNPAPLMDEDALARTADSLLERVDSTHGGFTGAPKFPTASAFELLHRLAHRTGRPDLREAWTRTLDGMAAGGVYDQLGGGFHRYSVDAEWLVPHFEKMLYDNAGLLQLYAEGWQCTGRPRYAEVTDETADFVLREMQAPEGGFYSTLDADSEGEEGRFYVWDAAELREVLSGVDERAAPLVETIYGVTEQGNFEGRNVLHRAVPVAEAAERVGVDPDDAEALLARSRRALFERRAQRIRPGRDEKMLTAWNGQMIAALARAALIRDRSDWREAAVRAADFVVGHLVDEHGACLRSYKDGRARFAGYLDDHAWLALGLLRLYEATATDRWLELAVRVADRMREEFHDGEGGWYQPPSANDDVVVRTHATFDTAVPAASAVAAEVLLRLSVLTERDELRRTAEQTMERHGEASRDHPMAFAHLLGVADLALGPQQDTADRRGSNGTMTLVLAGDDASCAPLRRAAAGICAPHLVLAHLDGAGHGASVLGEAIAQGREAGSEGARAYLCRGFACLEPTSDPETLRRQLTEEVGSAVSGSSAR